jgi:hypothetical protein
MFGFRNFTGRAFIAKIGNVTFEFAVGIIEEVTLNITASGVANATEIPENVNLNLLSKDQVVTTTSVAIGSKIMQSNVFGLIAGATPNLFI